MAENSRSTPAQASESLRKACASGPAVIGARLALDTIVEVARHGARIELDPGARERVARTRRALESALGSGRLLYGINTGLGALCESRIDLRDLRALQLNLLRSHAVGVGPELDAETTRALMLLRAHTLALGASGISLQVLERLIELLNHGVLPCVPRRGSVGASGDLAPLAHLALCLIGEGFARIDGERLPSQSALERVGLRAVDLGPKEGLSLINGTQLISAVSALAIADAAELLVAADLIGALSLDAHTASTDLLDPRIHAGKPHPGQRRSAELQRTMLLDSPLRQSHRTCGRVQDAYSFRCMPQVHGAVRDAWAYTKRALEVELNSLTDNPLVFEEADGSLAILSGGNFHGANITLPVDHLTAALCSLASISERRSARHVSVDLSRGLPPFLASDPGLESGFMMAQVTAAALVSECKTRSLPAGVDSIPTSAGQEDHVSMGPIAAFKLREVVDLCAQVLAIEACIAVRALDLREHPTSPRLECLRERIRDETGPFLGDRAMGHEFETVASTILRGELRRATGVERTPWLEGRIDGE